MTLENLAEKVKEMRGLQIRWDTARKRGHKTLPILEKQLKAVEQEVDKILLNHFYTPQNKQIQFFEALDGEA